MYCTVVLPNTKPDHSEKAFPFDHMTQSDSDEFDSFMTQPTDSDSTLVCPSRFGLDSLMTHPYPELTLKRNILD